MKLPDPVETGLTIAGVGQVAKQAQDFIAALSGHPGESLGTLVGNLTRRRRQNVESACNKAHFTLLNLGLRPEPVTLDVLQPLLEGASLQEDDELQGSWANLLANAGDPRKLTPVLPLFITFLRDLGPREVRFLDLLYSAAERRLANPAVFGKRIPGMEFPISELTDFYTCYGFSSLTNLSNLSVSEREMPEVQRELEAFWLLVEVITRNLVKETVRPSNPITQRSAKDVGVSTYHFSELGASFVRACRPPEAHVVKE